MLSFLIVVMKGFELDVHMTTSASSWASHENRVSTVNMVLAVLIG